VRNKEENEESDLGVFVRRVYLAIRSSPVVSLTSDEPCAYIYIYTLCQQATGKQTKTENKEIELEMISQLISSEEEKKRDIEGERGDLCKSLDHPLIAFNSNSRESWWCEMPPLGGRGAFSLFIGLFNSVIPHG
jgi:hypothetical protein